MMPITMMKDGETGVIKKVGGKEETRKFFSTVTPGQFPTNWLEPVSALNNVVLPQLGLPAKAIFIDMLRLPFHLFISY